MGQDLAGLQGLQRASGAMGSLTQPFPQEPISIMARKDAAGPGPLLVRATVGEMACHVCVKSQSPLQRSASLAYGSPVVLGPTSERGCGELLLRELIQGLQCKFRPCLDPAGHSVTSVIPPLGRLRQEVCGRFQASQGYRMKPCFKRAKGKHRAGPITQWAELTEPHALHGPSQHLGAQRLACTRLACLTWKVEAEGAGVQSRPETLSKKKNL